MSQPSGPRNSPSSKPVEARPTTLLPASKPANERANAKSQDDGCDFDCVTHGILLISSSDVGGGGIRRVALARFAAVFARARQGAPLAKLFFRISRHSSHVDRSSSFGIMSPQSPPLVGGADETRAQGKDYPEGFSGADCGASSGGVVVILAPPILALPILELPIVGAR